MIIISNYYFDPDPRYPCDWYDDNYDKRNGELIYSEVHFNGYSFIWEIIKNQNIIMQYIGYKKIPKNHISKFPTVNDRENGRAEDLSDIVLC